MKRLFVAVIAASLLLVACGKPEDKFVGKYDGEIDVPEGMIELLKSYALQTGGNPDEVEAGLTEGKIAMELRGDGTCIMSTTTAGKTELTGCTWTLNDDGTQISVFIEMDEAVAEELDLPSGSGRLRELSVSEDGKTLTYEEHMLGKTLITTFTRK